MRPKLFFLFCLLSISIALNAQLPKWIVGSSQQTSSGSFHPYATGNLKFFEINFKGSLTSTTRTIGASIQNIKSLGTQDVMQTAVDTTTNTVLFYAFVAAVGAWNAGFPTIQPDTFYFAAYNTSSMADEIFGKVPSDGWGGSVIESELVKKPGSSTEYYFIYKTQATSIYTDNIKYVTIDAANKTVSAPNYIVTSEKSGEGMAISQLDCQTNRRWLFVTRPEANGDITLRRCAITNAGISTPSNTYTISIPGNSTNVVVGVEISPTNNNLAVANYNNTTVSKNMILFDYNNNTGTVSNERAYTNQSTYPFVTMEFSPNGSRVYILQGGAGSVPNVIYNCPVTSTNYLVTSLDLLSSLTLNQSLTLETAYDGNIYIDPGQSSNFMYVINNPNSATPTITSTTSNFLGATNFMGSGFPDQIDGDKYNISSHFLSVVSTATTICSGQTTTITASGGNTYQWSGGSSSTSSVITVNPPVTTTYYLQSTNGGCSGNDSITVHVNPTPTVSINGNQDICSGQNIILTGGTAANYTWSPGGTTTNTISISPMSTTTYTLTGANGSCITNTVATVSVTPTPTLNISGATILCNGNNTVLTASGTNSYQWSGGFTGTSPSITVSPTVTTIYYLQGTSGICTDHDTISVQVITIVPAQFTFSNNPCVSLEWSFNSVNNNPGMVWYFGDGTTGTTINPTHLYHPGTYTITLITNPTTICADTTSRNIIVVDSIQNKIIPNVFTPNNDGINDELMFSGLGSCTEYLLEIYNRWGQKVFETDKPRTVFWNGIINTKNEVVEGMYYYLLIPGNGSSGSTIKGNVLVIR